MALGALASLAGGGGASASSSSSNEQKSSNDISTGTITVGGLTLNPKSSFDSDLILKGGAVVGLGLAALWAFGKIRGKK